MSKLAPMPPPVPQPLPREALHPDFPAAQRSFLQARLMRELSTLTAWERRRHDRVRRALATLKAICQI